MMRAWEPGDGGAGVPVPVSPNLAGVVRIDIDLISGIFNLPNCPIGAGLTTCTDIGYNIGAVSSTCTLNLCDRGCQATVVYADRPAVTGGCSITDGAGGSYGFGTVSVSNSQGCLAFSYEAAPDPNARVYFTDPAQNIWRIDDASWLSAGGQPSSQGTDWLTNTFQLHGVASDGTTTRGMTIDLSGLLRSFQACFSGTPAWQFSFSLKGSGVVQ